jgi:predicted amidophosphoribosyltransferase
VVDLPTKEGMMIYDQLMGVKDKTGHILLLCKECNAPAQNAKSLTILKVCSNCGQPLGEWATEAERDAELHEFAEKVRQQS